MTNPWQPIEDLPPDWERLHSTELESLAAIWAEKSEELGSTQAFKRFQERLHREWAIETGILENLYSLERGITEALVEHGFNAALIPSSTSGLPGELVVSILRDHQETLDWVFDFIASRRTLSTAYIKELHQLLTRHQTSSVAVDSLGNIMEVELLRGDYKRWPNNPRRQDDSIHIYCPPEHVASEMDRLVEMHLRHEEDRVPPEIEAAWLHHRFTQIHPFQDGNGRVVRALVSMVFIRAGWWPLVVDRDLRPRYITALEEADAGDLSPLVKLFVGIQRKAFTNALSLSQDVLRAKKQEDRERQLLDAVRNRVFAKSTEEQLRQIQDLENVTIGNLVHECYEGFNNVVNQLNQMFQELGGEENWHFSALSEDSSGEESAHYRHQVEAIARALDYYANTRIFLECFMLVIQEERKAELVIAFHALGPDFVGIFVASAFLLFRERNETASFAPVDGPYPVCREPFQYAYNERTEDVVRRFREWLDEVVIIGLDEWRKRL